MTSFIVVNRLTICKINHWLTHFDLVINNFSNNYLQLLTHFFIDSKNCLQLVAKSRSFRFDFVWNDNINKLAGYSYQQRTTNYNNNRLSTYNLIIISACSNFSQRCWIRGCRNLIYQHEKSFFLSPLMVFLEIFLKNRNMYISRYESKLKFFFVFYIQ